MQTRPQRDALSHRDAPTRRTNTKKHGYNTLARGAQVPAQILGTRIQLVIHKRREDKAVHVFQPTLVNLRARLDAWKSLKKTVSGSGSMAQRLDLISFMSDHTNHLMVLRAMSFPVLFMSPHISSNRLVRHCILQDVACDILMYLHIPTVAYNTMPRHVTWSPVCCNHFNRYPARSFQIISSSNYK